MLGGAIVAARLFQFASALVLFGSSLFYLYGLSAGAAEVPSRRWPWQRQVLLTASLAGLFATLSWVMAEAALLTDEASNAFDPASLWWLLTETRIGRVYLLRLLLLLASITVFWLVTSPKKLWIAQAISGGAVTTSFAWTGHGVRDHGLAGTMHLGADVLHLLAAGLWIGALVPLGVLILKSLRSRSEADARATSYGLDRFSGIGFAVVSVLLLSGIANSWFLIGPARWRMLFASGYGLLLVVKLVLFGLMLLLAAANRFRLAPALERELRAGGSATGSQLALRRSVLKETGLALLVLFAVSWMGTLEPPISGD